MGYLVQMLRNALLYGDTVDPFTRLDEFNLVNIFDPSENAFHFGTQFEHFRSEAFTFRERGRLGG